MKRIISLCFAAMLLAVPAMAFAQTPQEVMAKFSHEPTIEATMDAAIAYAGLGSDRLEGLYMRAGGSNALPKTVYYELTYRDQDRDQPQSVYTYENNDSTTWKQYKLTEYEQDTDYFQHRVRAQWDLSRIIFNPDQLRVVSAMNSAVKTRDTLLKSVTKAYYARRKLQVEATLNPPSNVSQKLDQDLKIQELTATLDALTGGWFSEQLKNQRH